MKNHLKEQSLHAFPT